MTAYYNEIEPYAAEWLHNLIAAGHIAPGVVDTRSIEDVHPADLQDFTQCHFFAGVGVWSLALRRAGWPDDRPVWTGSCPCQPFSAAGQGAGFADERHLWPSFYHLIKQHDEWCRAQKRRPPVIIGEQVASKDADPWIDLVQDDLEALGYAVGAVPFPSAGVGAPHIRDRLYWVADAQLQQRPGWQRAVGAEHDARRRQQGAAAVAGLRIAGGLAIAEHGRREVGQPHGSWSGAAVPSDLVGRMGVTHDRGLEGARLPAQRCDEGDQPCSQRDGQTRGRDIRHNGRSGDGFAADDAAGPTNGYWAAADWLGCRDGKWRPVEPGTFPLAHGAPARVGRLRAYGNAINAEAARVFVEAVMEAA